MKKKKVFDGVFPGDELIPHPRKIITNSIIIEAPPERIWPWLVQLGSGRAGWYSYDRIDNGGIPSAGKIIPELQHIEPGDILPSVPKSLDSFLVRDVYPGKTLVLVVPMKSALEEPDKYERLKPPFRVSWTLHLQAVDGERTRLISRASISPDWLAYSDSNSEKKLFIEHVYRLFSKMPWAIMLPFAMTGHYIMESHMLKGIKRRVEALQADPCSSSHLQ